MAGRPAFQPTDKQRGQVEAMAVVGIPEENIARALEISATTLRKHFATELDVSQTKIRVQIGTLIVNSILAQGDTKTRLTDERARATLAIFFAKTRMGWKETSIHEHEGLRGGEEKKEVSPVLQRITRRVNRLAAECATSKTPEEPDEAK